MNKAILNYEDIKYDLELEIFGISFGINISKNYYEKLINLQNEINNSDGSFELIERAIDDILGQGSFKKISEKYLDDIGKEMGIETINKILVFLTNEFVKYFERVSKQNLNRSQRRTQYRNNRNSRGYRRNDYRR